MAGEGRDQIRVFYLPVYVAGKGAEGKVVAYFHVGVALHGLAAAAVATAVLLEAQVTVFTVALSGAMVAESAPMVPTSRVSVAGATVTEVTATVAGVSGVEGVEGVEGVSSSLPQETESSARAARANKYFS